MRLILIGCEYSGKTTLADALEKWGADRGRPFHMDDSDFSIPDDRHLNQEEQAAMVALPPTIKERFQRFQIHYHVGIINRYDDCILGGFHIQEAIYGPRYYYPGRNIDYTSRIEHEIPTDAVLVLMTSPPDVVRERMASAPHGYPLVKPDEVEEIQAEFEEAFNKSQIRRKVRLDTSGYGPEEVLDRFLDVVRPKLDVRDLLLMA